MGFFDERKAKELKAQAKAANQKADSWLDPIISKAVNSKWTPLLVAGLLTAGVFTGLYL